MQAVNKIKGNFCIYANGEYVVIPSTKLHILKTDGRLVACRDDLRYAGKITFLSENRMLLSSSKAVYHMIDLRDGSDIWTTPGTKSDLNVTEFAVSLDEAYAYTYDERKGNYFISRLNLQTHDVDSHYMYMDSGATRGILCDEDGIPCLLKTLRETIGGKPYHQNGVRMHDFDGIAPGNTTCWKTKWTFDGARSAVQFLDSTDKVVTSDLHIYTPSTGELVDLLENETSWQRPECDPSRCSLDLSKRYLSVKYQTSQVFIDIHARKVVAQYATEFMKGCLIGDTFWICLNGRVVRKPFPAFEEAPPVKTVGWSWYYAKHPERW